MVFQKFGISSNKSLAAKLIEMLPLPFVGADPANGHGSLGPGVLVSPERRRRDATPRRDPSLLVSR